ncbi:MAG: hypothetical protein NZ898_03595 [Myxococcota bacterium]|nr:hypothetical protein [Myxococcota bacterium]MDW8361192.1 hypothetical protein [Myxococcales bacterium]
MSRAAALLTSLAACAADASAAERRIVEEHAPACLRIVREDIARITRGLRVAATRFAPGFAIEDADDRERQIRAGLRRIQDPTARGIAISELVATPASFLAAVGADGRVIARDVPQNEDRMRGEPFAERYEVVARALREGRAGRQLVEFPAAEGPPSVSLLLVEPVRRDERIVGAMLAGIPLWKMARRLSRQLVVDHAAERQRGAILWVWLYRGERLFAPEVGLDLEKLVPDAAARARGLAASPGGYTGQVQQFGRAYAFGVVPLPIFGDDVGMVIFRSDPP